MYFSNLLIPNTHLSRNKFISRKNNTYFFVNLALRGNYGNLLTVTHIWQKFRENNVSTKEVTKEVT